MNLKLEPDTRSKTITVLTIGSNVNVYDKKVKAKVGEIDGNWVYIKTDTGFKGWLFDYNFFPGNSSHNK